MQKIKDYVLQNGGVTVANGEIVNYENGYQVCVNSEEVKAKHLDTILDIVKYYNLKNYGIWYNGSDRLYYMDTNSIHVDDYLEAYDLAVENNQKAIFNWETFESIDTDYIYLVQEKEDVK